MTAENATQDPEDQVLAGAEAGEEDELIGRVLNDTYVIEGVIGEGGVGRVYVARHVRIRTKRFALKVLHGEHSRDPQQLARFKQEAEAAASLSHPNVVGVFDVGRTDDGLSYLACELLSGMDLDAYLEQRGRMDVRGAVLLALQICDALETAHSQNIVHRDLKPQNVFLQNGPDGTLPEAPHVKLLDFGLSRFLDHTDAQLTKTGTVMGTPAFMAPEQATGNRGDHRVDVYGIGVILYAALTGGPPFQEETLPAMLVAVMTQEPIRPQKLVPEIPEALEVLIQKAMAKHAEDRYQTVADLHAALLPILDVADNTLSAAPHRSLPTMHRGRLTSTLHVTEEAYELRTSRPRLLLYGTFAVILALIFLTSALSGLEIFTGPFSFSRTEMMLVMLGMLGTLAMPAVLAARHFKKTIWSNSAKVMQLLERLRGPVMAVILAYGLSAIAVRFLDDLGGRLGDGELFRRVPSLGWDGFTWILPGVALLTAGSVVLKRRLMEGQWGASHRGWLGAPLGILTALLCAGLLTLGFKWRAAHLDDVAAVEKARVTELAAQLAAKDPESPKSGDASTPQREVAKAEPVVLATDEELSAAIDAGVDGLLPLSEKCPKDPNVLEPLLLGFASRATGLADAMVTAEHLLLVAPEKRDSEALGMIVRRAASTPGNASDLAFNLMREKLGSHGADLLYQLVKAGGKPGERAAELLATTEVKKEMSPALRVAMELDAALTCEARLPLLKTAANLGDARAVAVLSPLARGSKTGCGKWKNRPCPPTCKDQSKEFLDVIVAIQKRASVTDL